jgi:hypothetical protein
MVLERFVKAYWGNNPTPTIWHNFESVEEENKLVRNLKAQKGYHSISRGSRRKK